MKYIQVLDLPLIEKIQNELMEWKYFFFTNSI